MACAGFGRGLDERKLGRAVSGSRTDGAHSGPIPDQQDGTGMPLPPSPTHTVQFATPVDYVHISLQVRGRTGEERETESGVRWEGNMWLDGDGGCERR
jgi:hypothetical protein